MDMTPEQQYREREKRVTDAIGLKVPDRVPVLINWSYFPAKYGGITCEDAYYDLEKWKAACKKATLDFQPDMCSVQPFFPGKVLEALDYRQTKWPGHGVSSSHGHQFVEGEYMKPGEYDVFLKDLSDYLVRSHLPRLCGVLEPLKTLPSLQSLLFGYVGVAEFVSELATPEFTGALEALLKAGREMLKYRTGRGAINQELKDLGFPIYSQALTNVPFDTISDFFRGMRGAMLDLYRQPDHLLEACETLLPILIERGVSAAKRSGNPRVFIPLHRGSDGFMSLEHFEIFYWPTMKRLVQALVDEGLTPCVFFEGDHTSRLEYLLELPKGKVLGHFDATDIFKAKEILGDHLCIRGNVPSSLLCVGSTQEVKAYCRKIIERVGKGGGFILSPGSSIDDAKPENIKAMIDAAGEYGTYD